jgi:hypothetical protein
MWTLVIIAFASGAGSAGSSTAISTLDFQDQGKCQTAAKAIAVADGIFPQRANPSGIYRVLANCVER